MFASSASSSSSSAVLRRQEILVRAFTRGGGRGGGGVEAPFFSKKPPVKMQQQQLRPLLESDATAIIRRITPLLSPNRYKGQAGKIAVIGGCREYTGAPYFAAISALRLGADLSHVFCTKDASPIIKSYSPELIVHPILEESYNMRDEEKPAISCKILSEITKWVERFDCLVVGPGLGRDEFLLECVSDIIKHARKAEKPIVFDADGLFLVTNNLDLIKGYPLAVLTPNVYEYKRLVEKVLGCEVDENIGAEQLLSLARSIGGATIFRKGKVDLISDGHTVHMVSFLGSPRRCGGQGDILSGSVGIFSSWARQCKLERAQDDGSPTTNPVVLGCIAGSTILRKAASLAFARKKRATLTSDIIELLGESMEILSPTQ